MTTGRARLGSWGAVALLAIATVGGDLDQPSDADIPADTEDSDPDQTDPDQTDEPRVTFCDERGDGWTPRSRLVSVVLERHIYHSGNIIPAFSAVVEDKEVNYPGLNLTTDFGNGVTGREILSNNCSIPISAAEPPPADSSTPPPTVPPITVAPTTTTPLPEPPEDEPVSPTTTTPPLSTTTTTTTTLPSTPPPPITAATTTTTTAPEVPEPPTDDAPPTTSLGPEPTDPAPTTVPGSSTPSAPDTTPPATAPRSDSQSSPPASGSSSGSGPRATSTGDGSTDDDTPPVPVIVFGGGDPGFLADPDVASRAAGQSGDASVDDFALVGDLADAASTQFGAIDPTQVSGETQSSLEPVAAIGFSLAERRSRTTLVIAAILGLLVTAIAFFAATGVSVPGRHDDY